MSTARPPPVYNYCLKCFGCDFFLEYCNIVSVMVIFVEYFLIRIDEYLSLNFYPGYLVNSYRRRFQSDTFICLQYK